MRTLIFERPLTSGALLVSLLAAMLLAVVVGMPTGSGQTSNQLAQSRWEPTNMSHSQRVRRESVATTQKPTNSSVSKKKKKKKSKSGGGGGGKATLVECLAAHNKWRRLHKVPDLEWDDKLAAFAQKRSDHIAASDGKEFGHPPDLPFGENLFWHSSLETGCDYMVKGWYDEIDLYDFKAPTFAPATGHFTQMVWRGTQKVGCAFATSSGPRGGLYLTCNYDPPGNWVGEFDENVPRPKTEVAPSVARAAASNTTNKPSTTIAPTTTTTTARPATTTTVASVTTTKPVDKQPAGAGTTKPKSKKKKGKKKNKKTDKKKAGDKKKNKKKNKKSKKKSSSTTPGPSSNSSTTPSNATGTISS